MSANDTPNREHLLRQTLDASLAGIARSGEIDDEVLALMATGRLNELEPAERGRVLDTVASDPVLMQAVHELASAFEEEQGQEVRSPPGRVLFRFTGGAWLLAACLTLFLGLMEPATNTIVQSEPGQGSVTSPGGVLNTESTDPDLDPDKPGLEDLVRPQTDGIDLNERLDAPNKPSPSDQLRELLSDKPKFETDRVDLEKDEIALQDLSGPASGQSAAPRTGFYLSLGMTVLLTVLFVGLAIRGKTKQTTDA